jgi:hypothetical protein
MQILDHLDRRNMKWDEKIQWDIFFCKGKNVVIVNRNIVLPKHQQIPIQNMDVVCKFSVQLEGERVDLNISHDGNRHSRKGGALVIRTSQNWITEWY